MSHSHSLTITIHSAHSRFFADLATRTGCVRDAFGVALAFKLGASDSADTMAVDDDDCTGTTTVFAAAFALAFPFGTHHSTLTPAFQISSQGITDAAPITTSRGAALMTNLIFSFLPVRVDRD